MQGGEGALGRRSALVVCVTALATLLMLQGTRVFVGYLVFVVDQSQRVTLGVTGLTVFAAPALVWLLLRVLPAERVLYAAAVLLIAARGVLQVWEHPTGRLVLGAVTIIAWGWLIIVCLGRQRLPAGIGIVLALALDIMLRMGFDSIDLPWMPDTPAHLLTFALLAAFAVAVNLVQDVLGADDSQPSRSIVPLVALGPALALHHIATGNLALGHATAETERATIWVAMLAGVALGYFLITIVSMFGDDLHRPLDRWVIAVATVAGAAGLWLTWTGDPPGAFGVVLVPASFLVLVGAVVAGKPVARSGSTVGQVALVVTVGLVLQVGLIFAYYTFTGLGTAIVVGWIILAASALWSSRLPTVPLLQTANASGLISRVVVLLVFVLPVVGEIGAVEPEADTASGDELTVMLYNIQSGFARDRMWDLSATARVIAAQDPDIIVLNEVSRGWLVTASNDQLVWLSRELDMPFVWGPASDDDLWGNAILSRVEMDEPEVRKFASTQNLKRSAIGVSLQVNGETLWVFGTHLDNPTGAGEARMEQVNELLAFRGDRAPALVLGDLNAEPDDDVLQALAEAGFSDPVAELLPEATTSQDGRRIDYILTAGDIEVLDVRVPNVDASDHKPVVAKIRVGR